jgi:DNA-binding phage protein
MADPQTNNDELAAKIARLVQERGWNMEEFARIARLNRQTIRTMMAEGAARKLRIATVGACAKALGLSVNELRTLPLERLLPRMSDSHPTHGGETLRKLYDKAWQPELVAWLERNAERARQLTPEEVEEVLTLQGPDGPLAAYGADAFVGRLERRRKLVRQVVAVAATEFLDLLEQFVGLLYDKVQPSR